MFARGGGSLNIERNGEAQLQRSLASWSARQSVALQIIDVGANYGQWTTSMLCALKEARAPRANIVLFEPVPQIGERLRESLRHWTDTADATVEGSAVSDTAGVAQFRVTDIAGEDHHLMSADYAFPGDNIEVQVATLDDYFASEGIDHAHLVKIDAEGYDPKVIEGMSALLSGGRVDIVQFEYGAQIIRSRAFLYDVFELANAHGYQVAMLSHWGIEAFRSWHFELERFYSAAVLLLHPRASEMVEVRQVAFGEDNVYE